jgi:hydrogenase nickel incorporation protein HypB
MCKDCGCGLPGENPVGIHAHHHDHDHDHGHGHGHHPHHDHSHPHFHGHSHGKAGPEHPPETAPGTHRTLEVRQAILEKNDRLAERNRGFFRAHGLLVLNILSSPGSGKTTFIRETVRLLDKRLQTGVIVGDLATDNDAQRLRETGVPVVQINTGTVCHLEAEMVARAVKELDLNGLGLLILENVGNLVCPAAYDLGEDLRVVMLSVTEGEDKPLKYPPAFQSADVVVISKEDLAAACDYDRLAALANLRRLAPQVRVFETSAKTGQGMDAWCEFLIKQHKALKAHDLLGAGAIQ